VAPPLPAPFDSQSKVHAASVRVGRMMASTNLDGECSLNGANVAVPRFVLAFVAVALPSALPVTLLVALRLAVALPPLVGTARGWAMSDTHKKSITKHTLLDHSSSRCTATVAGPHLRRVLERDACPPPSKE